MSTTPTCLIDASIYIFQYYFSLPDHWVSDSGWPTAAVYGYSTFLIRLLSEHQPDRVAACFDESLETGFRHRLYPAYKSSRALPDEGLAFQLKACRNISELLGIATYGSEEYEADDLLGSLYQQLQRSPQPIALLTRDKDLGQLLRRPQDYLWDYAANQRHYSEDIKQKFGVLPSQFIDYLALVGDPSDDIPGVPGIGQKTAAKLLHHYGSIEQLWQAPNDLSSLPIRGAHQLRDKLETHQEQLQLSQTLARIVTDIELIQSVNDLNLRLPQWARLRSFCSTMGFEKLFVRAQKQLG